MVIDLLLDRLGYRLLIIFLLLGFLFINKLLVILEGFFIGDKDLIILFAKLVILVVHDSHINVSLLLQILIIIFHFVVLVIEQTLHGLIVQVGNKLRLQLFLCFFKELFIIQN